MCRQDFFLRHIVTAQMDYRHRRDALNAFCIALADSPSRTALKDVMTDIEIYAKKRDVAAHAMWTKGRKPGTIKPLQFRARGGTIKTRGHHHNEPEYTAEDMETDAAAIRKLYSRLRVCLDGFGVKAFIASEPSSDAASIKS